MPLNTTEKVAVAAGLLGAIGIAKAVVSSRGKPYPILDKVNHVVVIVQENRSFDHYFGTYPDPTGQTSTPGVGFPGYPPGPCIPDSLKDPSGPCVNPSLPTPVDRDEVPDLGHGVGNASEDIDGGKMDGFMASESSSSPTYPDATMWFMDPAIVANYWTLAQNFALHARMFQPFASASLPNHMMFYACQTQGGPGVNIYENGDLAQLTKWTAPLLFDLL